MELEIQILNAEFACRCCGECCSGNDNEVMVSPDEIDLLCEATNLTLDQIAEPYPEWINDQGATFTFGRVLRRGEDGNCMFLKTTGAPSMNTDRISAGPILSCLTGTGYSFLNARDVNQASQRRTRN